MDSLLKLRLSDYPPRRLLRGVLDRIPGKDRRWFFAHAYAKWRFEHFLSRRVPAAWLHPVDEGPPWTPEIQKATSLLYAPSAESLARYPKHRFYYRAYKEMNTFLRMLDDHAFNLRTAGAVMEFGCGSARLLRMLRGIEGLRLVGADIDPHCVEWCKANVPGPEFYVTEPEPPLSFADASFDLVLSYSVFTHISSELQRPWLEEIRRVLRPGGFFLCTIIGHSHRLRQLRDEDLRRFDKDGEVVLDSDCPSLSYSSKLRGLCDIFQTRHKAIENCNGIFELCDFLPSESLSMGQDVLVLRKR